MLRPDFLLNDEVMPTVASIARMDVFLPLPLGADAVTRRGDENYNLMARLKPGVTMAQAQSDVTAIADRIREKDKRDRTFTISVVPLLEQVVGNVRRAVLVLLGSVALVLLIACANVANLLLTRATTRQKEVAIRTALGARWQRLVRQLLMESVLLGVMGGSAGLLIAEASLYVVRTVNPGNIPRLDVLGIDRTVLAFTFLVSVLTGIVFGLAPAVRAARVDLNTGLKAGGRNTQGDGGFGTSRRRLRSLLVVSEVAFSLMLLIGAGLLVRSFVRLQSVSPGFDPENVISMRLGASGQQFPNREAAVEFYRQFGDRIANVPGVKVRGAVTALPFTSSVGWGGINVEGFTPQPGQELQVDQRATTPDYFKTMQIPLVKGRFFSDFDTAANAQPVVIVDEKFARRFWPNEDPIGKHVWNDPKRQLTIVGVVGTVKQYGLDIDGRIVVYRPSPGLLSYQVARTVFRSRRGGRRDRARDSRGRSDHPRLRHSNHAGSDEGLDGTAAILDDHARRVRGVRADSGGSRRLWRDVVPGDAGNARYRRAHGARGAARQYPGHGCQAGPGAHGRRNPSRSDRRSRADARDGQLVIWRERHRPRDLLGGAPHSRHHGPRRLLPARAARDARGSRHRPAGGVVPDVWRTCTNVQDRHTCARVIEAREATLTPLSDDYLPALATTMPLILS